MYRFKFVGTRLAISLIALAMVGCVTSPTGRRQLMLVSPSDAISISSTAYLTTISQLGKQNKLLRDPWLEDRVSRIAGRLVTVAVEQYPESAEWNWSVALIDEPEEVNAWCMAGGRMAIYSGMFEKLQVTDDELAHVLGHEISHAVANHTAERMSRALLINTGLTLMQVLVEDSRAGTYGGLLATLALELPNSRTAETEADQLGMELVALAGYDPYAAVSLWEKMEGAGNRQLFQFLSTHPAPENRQRQLAELAPQMVALNPNMEAVPVHPITIAR